MHSAALIQEIQPMETSLTSSRTVPIPYCTGFPTRLLGYSVVKVLQKSRFKTRIL
jgi:hypothetical protein